MMSRTHIAIILSAAFFLLAAAGFWYLSFSLSAMEAYGREAREKIYLEERKFHQARSFVRLHAETAKARAEELSLFVPEDDPASFIAEVERAAETAGVSHEVVNVDLKKAGETPFGELSLSLRFSGSFADAYQFLSLVETLPYTVSVESASFDREKENTRWEGLLMVTVLTRASHL